MHISHVALQETSYSHSAYGNGTKNAIFVKEKSAEIPWNDSITCRAWVYTGFAETIRLDREKSFSSNAFLTNAEDLKSDL